MYVCVSGRVWEPCLSVCVCFCKSNEKVSVSLHGVLFFVIIIVVVVVAKTLRRKLLLMLLLFLRKQAMQIVE